MLYIDKEREYMGTSGAVELELERRESLRYSSKSQLGTHWLILGGVASKTVVLVQKEKGAAEETILMFVPSSFTLFFKLYRDYHVFERERLLSTGREYRKKKVRLFERERERGFGLGINRTLTDGYYKWLYR